MKKANTFLTMMLGMLTFGFVLASCGDDAADDATDGDATEDVSDDAAASGDAGDMKAAMLDMTKRMHGIIEGIESADDVAAAEGEITAVFDDLVASIESAMKSGASMQDLEGMMDENDPEMKEWSDKMDKLTEELEAKDPAAAAALEQMMATQGMRLMSVVMQNMSAEDMQDAMGGLEDAAEDAAEAAEEAVDAATGE